MVNIIKNLNKISIGVLMYIGLTTILDKTSDSFKIKASNDEYIKLENKLEDHLSKKLIRVNGEYKYQEYDVSLYKNQDPKIYHSAELKKDKEGFYDVYTCFEINKDNPIKSFEIYKNDKLLVSDNKKRICSMIAKDDFKDHLYIGKVLFYDGTKIESRKVNENILYYKLPN